MKNRCSWVSENSLCIEYHDKEWGAPVFNDQILFEFLILETFQAGLSWSTILNKRAQFRIAFDGFDCQKIAKYTEEKYKLLMQDRGIIRNSLKIRSAITNAHCFMAVQKEYGSFSKFIWAYVLGKPILNTFENALAVPASTVLSKVISKDLKKLGFKFMGPTTVYAYMQAVGLVKDHTTDCFKF
ncbi:guanosine monophosphate synthetase GuaA [Polaribacter irgensii 23-P]|uniref:Guanosine monophosphate synthetase GuaA n=1 Tax=Polaribacter irgensii 23-P TaxID=313594 RepID=A4C000_9FLAO|nr:DNA-3-methyladenine glycosylase I [Polaribacter irgensii]EAR12743.1 guanosine monophosphate synthetase GuaA [Polaribacter irgensii 23-P]